MESNGGHLADVSRGASGQLAVGVQKPSAAVGPETLGPETLGPEILGPETLGTETLGPDTVSTVVSFVRAENPGAGTLGENTLSTVMSFRVAESPEAETIGANTLGADTLFTVPSFLSWKDMSRARLVNRNWRQNAPSMPLYRIKNRNSALALQRASHFSKRISQIFYEIHRGDPLDFAKGEDSLPEPRSRRHDRATRPIHLEACIANVEGLRELTLVGTNLNGFYKFLFQFRRLRVLVLSENYDLKWDLSGLANLPMLEILHCKYDEHLTGNLRDVRVLQSGLKQLDPSACGKIEGSVHDLADFPCLEVLYVSVTKITGDIRNIYESDFPPLEK